RRVERAIFRKPHDGLHKWNGFDCRPTGGARDATGRAVGANDAGSVKVLAVACGFDFEMQSARIGTEADETRVEGNFSPGLLRFLRQCWDQFRSLDDEIGLRESDLRRAAVGEKFESADFVEDAGAGRRPELIAEMIGDDERPRFGLESRFRFEHTDVAAAARQSGGGIEPGGRSADNDDFVALAAGSGLRCDTWHGSAG